MTDKEKLEKIKSLADKMYSRMAYLTSDTRPIRKAMEEYHQFIINEYHKEEPVSEDLEEAADNALNNVLNAHEIVNIRSCLEMFKYGAQWKEKETLQDVKEKLLHMLNTSIDNKHFFEQLDDYIDELENK